MIVRSLYIWRIVQLSIKIRSEHELATVEDHPAITPENQQRVMEIQMLLSSCCEDAGSRTISEPTVMHSLPTITALLLKSA